MKKFLVSLAVLALFSAIVAVAETTTTVTNRGQVIVIKTYSDMATDVRDLDVYQDYSTYPTKPGECGKIVRFYDFDAQGGTAGVINLLPANPLPDNMLVRDGYVDVMTVVAPVGQTRTNSIGLLSAADLVAAATNSFITADSDVDIVPASSAATSIKTTSATNLVSITLTGDVTAGKLMVVLDAELAP